MILGSTSGSLITQETVLLFWLCYKIYFLFSNRLRDYVGTLHLAVNVVLYYSFTLLIACCKWSLSGYTSYEMKKSQILSWAPYILRVSLTWVRPMSADQLNWSDASFHCSPFSWTGRTSHLVTRLPVRMFRRHSPLFGFKSDCSDNFMTVLLEESKTLGD